MLTSCRADGDSGHVWDFPSLQSGPPLSSSPEGVLIWNENAMHSIVVFHLTNVVMLSGRIVGRFQSSSW